MGSIEKFRGVRPWVGSWPIAVRWPEAASTEKMAMLSWPRLEPYTNLPDGWTTISAVVFSPLKPLGSVEIVWTVEREPFSASYQKAVIVLAISLMTIGEAARGMKGEVPRARAGRDHGGRRIVRRELSGRRVEAIDEDAVGSQVGREGEAIGRVDVDRMGVRAFLPLPIGPLAVMGDDGTGRLQAARLVDGEHGDRPPFVVGDEDILSRFVDDQVAGPGPLGGLLVEPGEVARRLVDGKGHHATGRLAAQS